MEEWTTAEAALFEEAMEKHGKTFNDIWTDYLPWKTVKVAISVPIGLIFPRNSFYFSINKVRALCLSQLILSFVSSYIYFFFLSLMSIVYELLNQYIL